MMKLLTRSSCILCRTILPQMSSINIRKHSIVVPNIEESKENLLRKQRNDFKRKQNTHHNKVYAKQQRKKIEAVKEVLQKHKIDLEQSMEYKKIFYESPWTIEKRIIFLKELGATRIDLHHIEKFIQRANLSTKLIKAACSIESGVDLTKNLFSHVKDPNFDHEIITSINEELPLREFFVKCLCFYLKQKLNANEDELLYLTLRKGLVFMYNSFSLVEETLNFLMNELNYEKALILQNRSLLGLHPDQGKVVLQMLKEYFGDLTSNMLKKYPKIIEYDVYDLEIFLTYLKELEVLPSNVAANHGIFHLCSAEFKRRQNNLLNNPFTVVYKKHPRFLSLVKDYYIILPRIRYLQEKNLKFATIHSLTTFHNHFDQLISVKKLTKRNLKFFLKSQYGEDAALLTEQIQKHSFHQYAPLMQMHETLDYLKKHYTKEVIYKHVYALLYHVVDLIAARKKIMSNPQYREWPSDRILAMCVYEIEEKSHFTGEAVLTPHKYAEGCGEESVPELSTEDGTKNN